jgi:hypothetical protein
MDRVQFKFMTGKTATRPVFVIGTGRSGTHWLGYTIGNHHDVISKVEASPMFGLSTRMALNQTLEKKLFWRLVLAYKYNLLISYRKLFLDKTHPNIWLADKLHKVFPEALFIGIERNPYATVASMMRHKGVTSWHQSWRKYPIPNRFLGITSEIAKEYDSIPFASQCALRWHAHHIKMKELRETLSKSLIVISYESFVNDTEKTIDELKQFLGLRDHIPVPEVKDGSLNKWEKQLAYDEIKCIESIVGFSPDISKS